MNEKLNNFFEEFKALQQKYSVFVSSDYDEQIDYDWEEEPYVSGISSYLVIYDSNKEKQLAIIDWEDELIINE